MAGAGLWVILLLVDPGDGSVGGVACLASHLIAALAEGPAVFCAEIMVEEDHRITVDGIGREMGHWPKRGRRDATMVQRMQPVPGHEQVLPVGVGP